jgi:murein DD-endopeptidase MepM/ murein hydrolase activator NlpD
VSQAWQKANDDYQTSMNRFLEKYNCVGTSDDTGSGTSDSSGSGNIDCTRIHQFFDNEAQLADSTYASGTTNIFSWPIPSRRITAYFRDPSYYATVGAQHDAIDIGTPQGTDVTAPADGYVYYILAPAPGNYSYLAIKHKDGYVTVYGHLSEIDVEPYQFVHAGDIIAKSGGMPGTPGAGPATTGPHLHFEVWKDKEPVDPLRYLSIADVDYASLPSLYQQKFISDLVEKSGSGVDTSDYQLRFTLK